MFWDIACNAWKSSQEGELAAKLLRVKKQDKKMPSEKLKIKWDGAAYTVLMTLFCYHTQWFESHNRFPFCVDWFKEFLKFHLWAFGSIFPSLVFSGFESFRNPLLLYEVISLLPSPSLPFPLLSSFTCPQPAIMLSFTAVTHLLISQCLLFRCSLFNSWLVLLAPSLWR